MSSTTFQFVHRVNGVLTDATTVLMSDPTGAFGARRTDTSAAVVADGTAMTRVSAGVYQYELTDPAAGLTYEWWAEYTYDGITNRAEFSETGGVDLDAGTTGSYVNLVRARNKIGELNTALLSDLERTLAGASEDSSVVAQHQAEVNRYVDTLAALEYGWTDLPIDSDHAHYQAVSDAATEVFIDSLVEAARLASGAYDPANPVRTLGGDPPLRGEARLRWLLEYAAPDDADTDDWIPTGVATLEPEPRYPWSPDYPLWNN